MNKKSREGKANVDKQLSREELLSGGLNRSRRAARLLAAIEARCLYMRAESRRVVAAYLVEGDEDFQRRFDVDYIQSLKLTAATDETLLLDAIERYASQWKSLIPADPDLRARVLKLIQQKYGLGLATLAALGGAEQAVQTAYQQLFGRTWEELSTARTSPGTASLQAWEDIETRLEWLSLTSGEILFRAGDPSDALYVVISGRLHSSLPGEDGGERLMSEMGRGELIGELGVLSGIARTVTVRAERDSELVRLSRVDLFALAQQHLEVMIRINALLARRMSKQPAQPGSAGHTLLTYALVPCNAAVPLQEFGRQLARAFGKFGPTTYVTCSMLDDAIEPGAAQAGLEDPRNSQIVSWLSELESRYRYVIYEASPEASEWSRRCIRQADRIVLVGVAGASPHPAAHEVELLRNEPGGPAGSYGLPRPRSQISPAQRSNRVELVLLHSRGTAFPKATTRWLGPRSLRGHYHIRSGDSQDLAYLARCLTGHALGLVLAGGGARGFAHVGVYRAIEEAGMQVDLVGGTSMGALITGGIGMGMDWRQMREISAGLASPLKIFDPTLPVVSLFTGGKVTGILQKIYGDTLIEDLWRPVFCVSSNLTHSSETIYRQGPLWKAVRASMSIPGIFSPVLHDGDVQVDGAVMNNLPVDVMRELGMTGTVIGVNVMPLDDLVKGYRFGDAISGPRAALSMVNPFDDISVPNIYETLVRVMALHEAHQEEAKRRLTDIYITPPVEKYNILDFGSYDAIMEAGYQSAQEALAKWKSPDGSPLQQLDSALADLEKTLDALRKKS
jgi:predicted acylesterase/phospholipase RssA